MLRKAFTRNNIAASSILLSLLTVFIKAIGFIKQAVISYYFGASSAMDAYLVVTDFVSEVGVMFFSSIAITLLSIYSEERGNETKKNTFISNAFSGLLIFSIILIAVIVVFAKPIVTILAPGFPTVVLADATTNMRLIAILLINICISNICIAILNAEKKFGTAKSIGLIQSACIIVACVFFEKTIGIKALYYGFSTYYIIENVFLLIHVRKYISFNLGNPFRDSRVIKMVRLSVPVFIGSAIVQINAMIDKAIASNLDAGCVSGMSYGHFVFSTIHSILIASVTTVLYTYYSNYVVEGDKEAIIKRTKNSLLLLTALLVPICITCCINCTDIVRLIYGRGSFDLTAIKVTSAAFLGYAFGIVAIAIRDVFFQVLYAYQKTKTTMINGIIGVVINVIVSIILSRYVGVFGIAIGDSIAYTILAYMSYKSTSKVIPEIKTCVSLRDICVIGVGLAISLGAGLITYSLFINAHYFIRLVVDCSMVFLVYYTVLLLFRHESIVIIKNYLIKRAG